MRGHPTPSNRKSFGHCAGETRMSREADRGSGYQPFYMAIAWHVGHTLHPLAGITHVLLNMADEVKPSALTCQLFSSYYQTHEPSTHRATTALPRLEDTWPGQNGLNYTSPLR